MTSDEIMRKVLALFEEARKTNPNGTTKGLSAWFDDKKPKKSG